MLLIVSSCTGKVSESKIFFSECAKHTKKVSLAKLIYNPNRNDNRFIEVIGVYHSGFEKSILTRSISITSKENSIWINLPQNGSLVMKSNPDSTWSRQYSSYMNGKKMRIIGKFTSFDDQDSEGISGEIDNICFIEIWN